MLPSYKAIFLNCAKEKFFKILNNILQNSIM